MIPHQSVSLSSRCCMLLLFENRHFLELTVIHGATSIILSLTAARHRAVLSHNCCVHSCGQTPPCTHCNWLMLIKLLWQEIQRLLEANSALRANTQVCVSNKSVLIVLSSSSKLHRAPHTPLAVSSSPVHCHRCR